MAGHAPGATYQDLEKRIEQISDQDAWDACNGSSWFQFGVAKLRFWLLNKLNYQSMSINQSINQSMYFKFLPGVSLFYAQFFQDPLEKRIQDAELLRDLYVRNGKEHPQFPWQHEPNRKPACCIGISGSFLTFNAFSLFFRVHLVRRMRRDNWTTRSRKQRRLDS